MSGKNKIFKGQDYELTLETNTDLSTMNIRQIKYKKPGGNLVYPLTATLVGTTQLRVNITNVINNLIGEWVFQAYNVAADGKIYWGDIARLIVWDNI